MAAKNPTTTNTDPTDHSDMHAVGTSVGVVGGAAAGAAIGSAAGPIGTAIGGVVGAVAGGVAGKGVAESVNPVAEDSYWRENYTRTPGYKPDYTYDDYAPAYRTGYTGWERARASGESFEAHEPRLRSEWERSKGESRLQWEEARDATRAAWHRLERAIPGDADKDGR